MLPLNQVCASEGMVYGTPDLKIQCLPRIDFCCVCMCVCVRACVRACSCVCACV